MIRAIATFSYCIICRNIRGPADRTGIARDSPADVAAGRVGAAAGDARARCNRNDRHAPSALDERSSPTGDRAAGRPLGALRGRIPWPW